MLRLDVGVPLERFDLSPSVARPLSHRLAHRCDRKSNGLHLTMLRLCAGRSIAPPSLQVLLEHVQRAPAGAADAECRDGQGVGGRLALGNAGGVMLNTGLAISASGSMFSPRMLFVVSVMVWFSGVLVAWPCQSLRRAGRAPMSYQAGRVHCFRCMPVNGCWPSGIVCCRMLGTPQSAYPQE